MATTQSQPGIFEELANLFTGSPTTEQLLQFRPSRALQRRAENLLSKQGENSLTSDEQRELDGFLHAEFLIRLVKGKLRRFNWPDWSKGVGL